MGIQPVKHMLELEEQIWLTQPNREEVIHLLVDLYSDLQQKSRMRDFIVFNDLGKFEFADFVHTRESGSIKTAQIYSEIILQDFKEWGLVGNLATVYERASRKTANMIVLAQINQELCLPHFSM